MRDGSEHIHELSGKPAGVTPTIYKMAQVKEHEPEIFADAYKVMDVHGYVTWMLTGLRAMGGGTRSLLWRQIMADTTALPITVCTQDEISPLGAAVLAIASTGVYGEHDVAATAKKMAQYGETIEPDIEKHEQYSDVAKVQRKLYPKLKDVFEG